MYRTDYIHGRPLVNHTDYMVDSKRNPEPQRERTVVTQKALRALAPSLRQLAQETGLSYSTLKAWSSGHRTPHGDHLRALADLLEQRSTQFRDLAGELRREAEE